MSDPKNWSAGECADKLLEADKDDVLEDIVWELRGDVFFNLKGLGKFGPDVEGSDVQPFVDQVIKEIVDKV